MPPCRLLISKCSWQWKRQTSFCSQDLEKLEMKRRITWFVSTRRGRAQNRNGEVYVGRFCHSQLVLQLLNYKTQVSSCETSPSWHHTEISKNILWRWCIRLASVLEVQCWGRKAIEMVRKISGSSPLRRNGRSWRWWVGYERWNGERRTYINTWQGLLAHLHPFSSEQRVITPGKLWRRQFHW